MATILVFLRYSAQQHIRLIESGEGFLTKYMSGNPIPTELPDLEQIPPHEKYYVFFSCEEENVPQGALWYRGHGENPISSFYMDGELNPDWELIYSTGNHDTFLYRGVRVEISPSMGSICITVAELSIYSVDRNGNLWEAADVIKIRRHIQEVVNNQFR